MSTLLKQINTRLLAAQHVLLVPHQNSDGDTLGALTSLLQYLTEKQIPVSAFCATAVPSKLRYLPGTEKISTDPAIWRDKTVDVVVVFDSGDLTYAGVAEHIAKRREHIFLINIDHHFTNTRYGDLNLVIPTASSTAEIMHSFFYLNHLPLTPIISTCLLTGLITDTDHFTNAATSKTALFAGSNLLTHGGHLGRINQAVLNNKSSAALGLWGRALTRLTLNPTADIVFTYVTKKDLAELASTDSDIEGIANYLNNVNEGRAALILKELPDGKVKGSWRTTRDDTDVSAWAKALGGGGHKKAAGFTVDGPIAAALELIWKTIL